MYLTIASLRVHDKYYLAQNTDAKQVFFQICQIFWLIGEIPNYIVVYLGTMAKTELLYLKNVGAWVAMNLDVTTTRW